MMPSHRSHCIASHLKNLKNLKNSSAHHSGGLYHKMSGRRRQLISPKSTNPVNEQGISECFQVFSTELYVSLAPSHLTNPINGIKAQHLDPLIMNYFPKAQGVVIGYQNIQLQHDNSLAKVGDSSPFVFLWISLDLLIWRPQVGDILEGHIYMQTASHIGLLIHDTFNASIKKFNIPQDWRFIPSQIDEEDEENADDDTQSRFKSLGYWEDENGNKIDGKVKFYIRNIHSSGRLVSIDGTLIEPGSERENQPVFKDRRASLSNEQFQASQPVNLNQHKKFDDDDETTTNNETTDLPHYSEGSENENAIVNDSDESD